MSLEKIEEIVREMDPEKALSALAVAAKDLFPLLEEEARLKFVMALTGEAGKDKIASMVHL